MRPNAPTLPRSLDELTPWRVYADGLLERGDPLGAVLAEDLALEAPDGERREAFQELARPVCTLSREFEAGWLLGQVRTIAVKPSAGRPVLSHTAPSMSEDAVRKLRLLLGTPLLAQLEALSFPLAEAANANLARTLDELPPTCTTLEVEAKGVRRVAAGLLERLPAHLEVLRPLARRGNRGADFISDRLRWVDLRAEPLFSMNLQPVLDALASTTSVRLMVGDVSERSVLEALGDRAVLGGPDDARLVDESTGMVALVERAPLLALQRRVGILTARSQLLREAPEWFGLSVNSVGLRCRAFEGSALLRRADGSWWVRSERESGSALTVALEGVLLGAEPMELEDGAQLQIAGRTVRFHAPSGSARP